jgi:hypothetical protein
MPRVSRGIRISWKTRWAGLDPRTGEHREFTWPTIKKGAPEGSLAMEPDRDGNWWLATMFQTGLVRFNVKDNTFKVFPLPAELNNSEAQQSMVPAAPVARRRQGVVDRHRPPGDPAPRPRERQIRNDRSVQVHA